MTTNPKRLLTRRDIEELDSDATACVDRDKVVATVKAMAKLLEQWMSFQHNCPHPECDCEVARDNTCDLLQTFNATGGEG